LYEVADKKHQQSEHDNLSCNVPPEHTVLTVNGDPNTHFKQKWSIGLLYSLYMVSGTTEETLLDMANLLYTPAQNNAG